MPCFIFLHTFYCYFDWTSPKREMNCDVRLKQQMLFVSIYLFQNKRKKNQLQWFSGDHNQNSKMLRPCQTSTSERKVFEKVKYFKSSFSAKPNGLNLNFFLYCFFLRFFCLSSLLLHFPPSQRQRLFAWFLLHDGYTKRNTQENMNEEEFGKKIYIRKPMRTKCSWFDMPLFSLKTCYDFIIFKG